MRYTITTKMWLYHGESASWHFLTVPKKISKEIRGAAGTLKRRGWGSVRVSVTVGKTTWNTSIFPDSRSGTYLLPVKAAVRQKEGIFDGDEVSYRLTLLDLKKKRA